MYHAASWPEPLNHVIRVELVKAGKDIAIKDLSSQYFEL